MQKIFKKSNNKRSFKYSFVASLSIMVFLFTFITSTAYGETTTTTTVTNIGNGFNGLTGIAVDSSGDIYVEDNFEGDEAVIKKIDISKNTTTTAAVGFEGLFGIALDSSDNIYVSDFKRSCIYKADIHDGNPPTFFDELNSPKGIALDRSGNIYVATSNNIRKYDSDGTRDDNFNINPNINMDLTYGVAVDSNGNIYVEYCSVQDKKFYINKFASNGTFICTIGEGIFSDSCFKQIAVDNSDNIYISENNTENGKNIIYKMNTKGQIEVYASYDSEEQINGIAVDNDGNIYVTEGKDVKKIAVSPELQINTANPPNGTIATAYSYTFTSTGGIGTKTYAVTEGSLPSGLKLSTDGTLSGIPTTIGGGTFTIKVTDSATPIASTSSTTVNLTVMVPDSGGRKKHRETSEPAPTLVTDSTSDSSQVMATVSNSQLFSLPVKITTGADGTKAGTLEIKQTTAKEIVDSLKKQGEDTAVVNMPDQKGELSSLTASIPTAAIATFVDSGKNLELETPNGGVILSNQNMKDYANTSNQALYFTITPVKDAMAQTETDIRAVKQQIQQLQQLQQQLLGQLTMNPAQRELQQQIQQLQQQLRQLQQLSQSQPERPTNGIINETKERKSELQGLSNDPIRVGSSVDIESNMPHGISMGIRIPMGPVNSPAQEAEIKKDSASYAIFAEHSIEDIENILISTIRIKDMAATAEANTSRFSRFTIIRLSQKTTDGGSWQNDEQGWKYIENGEPVTGWNQIDGYWYLMDSNGIMQKGWQQVNGEWYYLNSDGTMASNTVIDGYQLGDNGAWSSI